MVLRLSKYYKRNELMVMTNARPIPQKAREVSPVRQSNKAAPVRVTDSQNIPSEKEYNQTYEHQVQPGDTLYAISKRYGVSVADLKTWNQIGEANIISVGQKLTIRK